MDKGIKSIALTSSNPAYNPYHPALIRVKNVEHPNFIKLEYSYPYNLDKANKAMELVDKEKNLYKECGMIKSSPGSSLICSVSYSNNIDDTISITNSNGESYHRAYGVVHSKGDTVTSEINQSIDLAYSFSDSRSISVSENEGTSNALEHVYTVINSNSNTVTDTTENTHTSTHEDSYTYTENEEHSHTRTDGGEHIDEHNWSDSTEISHMDEYSRMDLADYNAVKDRTFVKRNDNDLLNKRGATAVKTKKESSKWGEVAEAVGNTASDTAAGCILGSAIPIIGTVTGCVGGFLVGATKSIANVYSELKSAHEAAESNDYAKQSANAADLTNTYAKQSADAADLANTYAKQSADAADTANTYAKQANDYANDANKIAERSIVSQEEIARLDRELQVKLAKDSTNHEIRMALAGTRSTSDTITTIHNDGYSESNIVNWSDAYTDTSGFSNSWGTTNGYSDAYTTGRSESVTTEESISDSVSKMLTTSFNKETGWVNEESKSQTTSNGYSYGQSNQQTTTNNLSIDQAIDTSAEYALQRAKSRSRSETVTKQVNFVAPDNKCYSLTAFPLFRSEINIWISGYYDAYEELKFDFTKSINPVEFINFVINPVECGDEDNFQDIVKNDISRFVFTEKENVNVNTLKKWSCL